MTVQAVRRLPLRQAIDSLKAGEGSTPLRQGVKGLTMRYIPKNAESGPREFVRSIAPRIAYTNPALSFNISAFKDPRSAEKSKDPKDKTGALDWKLDEVKPKPEMVVEFLDGTTQTISLEELSASAIYSRLLAVAGETTATQAQT